MNANLNQCPSGALLDQLLLDELSGGERDAIEAHVESCMACQKELERMVPNTVEAESQSLPVYDVQSEIDAAFLGRLKTLPPPRGPIAGQAVAETKTAIGHDHAIPGSD